MPNDQCQKVTAAIPDLNHERMSNLFIAEPKFAGWTCTVGSRAYLYFDEPVDAERLQELVSANLGGKIERVCDISEHELEAQRAGLSRPLADVGER
jgi:hypothetical protein